MLNVPYSIVLAYLTPNKKLVQLFGSTQHLTRQSTRITGERPVSTNFVHRVYEEVKYDKNNGKKEEKNA